MKKMFLTSTLLSCLSMPILASEIKNPDQALEFISEQIEKTIKDIDVNSDGFISLEEYTNYHNEKIYYFDHNQDQILNKDEYSDYIISHIDTLTKHDPEMRPEFKQMKKAEVEMIIQKFDVNKDDGLDEKELSSIFAHVFSKIDINQDEKIDLLDIEAIKNKP